ncbi:RNA polymerase subunit sigma [Kibdelosporangium sp. 4NS15]|uniref:RNA polymerase subunit sigma n=2 Tax=Kibdelosporangium persicum TaxID=2698649 RepID=A0ABX2F6A3_9PSEU|nr:RNA polymerase subunit sigma [Kibdelosporangium persicum]
MIGHPDEREMERWRSSDAAVMRADLDRALGLDTGSLPAGTEDAAPRRPADRPASRPPRARPTASVRPADREPDVTRWGDTAKEAPRQPSDAELIEAVRGGTIQAYAQLYTRHVHAAQNLARQVARSPVEAEDLVSDAFAKVLASLLAGGGPDSAFRPYLLTALRHTAYDKTRRDRKVELADDVEAVTGVERVTSLPFHDTAVTQLDRSLVVRAFASLPERWQTVLWHTEIEGQAPAEIAPLLGLTPNSVSATAYRAREGLRKAYLQAHVTHNPPERCRAAAAKLGSWTRSGLSRRETAQVEAHLDGCVECRALAAELADVNGALRGVVAPLVLGVGTAGYLAAGTGKAAAAVSLAASSSTSVLPWLGAATSTAVLVIAITSGADAPNQSIGPTTVAEPPPVSSTSGPTTAAATGPAVSATLTPKATPPPPPVTAAPAAGQPSAASPRNTPGAGTATPALTLTVPSGFTTSTGGPPTTLPITIRNSGTAPAPPPTLTLSLPDDVKVVGPGNNLLGKPLLQMDGAAQQTVSCPAGKDTVVCAADQQVAPGDSVTFVFRLLAGPKAVSGTITATTDSAVPLRTEVPVTITPKK